MIWFLIIFFSVTISFLTIFLHERFENYFRLKKEHVYILWNNDPLPVCYKKSLVNYATYIRCAQSALQVDYIVKNDQVLEASEEFPP